MTPEQEFFFVLKLRNDAIERGMIKLALAYGHWAVRIGLGILQARDAARTK